jgi:hypothetical protein
MRRFSPSEAVSRGFRARRKERAMTLQLDRPIRDLRTSTDRPATPRAATNAIDDAPHVPHSTPASVPTDLTLAGTWGY